MAAENDDMPLPEEMPGPADENDAAREIAGLRAENDALKDRALRALAEVENVRKRLERERDEAKAYSVTRFARDLLNVADNLARALTTLTPDARARADDALKAVLDGIEATARELTATLGRHGVKEIQALGAKFDPHLHQAIAEVPAEGVTPGTVVNVVQSGYIIGDRLLRPAMVTIAKSDGGRRPASNGGGLDTTV